MRHRTLTTTPVALALAVLLVAVLLRFASATDSRVATARQVVPTPAGHLGGPEPLSTGSAPANQQEEITPTPAEEDEASCRREPIPEDRLFAAVLATPAPEPGDLGYTDIAASEQIEAATALVEELIACANANQPLRTLALYTPDGAARSLARQGITPQTVGTLLASGGEPLPESAHARLMEIGGVLAAGQDRLRAEFTLLERTGVGESRLQTYQADLVLSDGSWLIADLRPI